MSPYTLRPIRWFAKSRAWTIKDASSLRGQGGEQHTGIVDPGVWRQVQALLQRNGRNARVPVRNKVGALLRRLLRCVPCGCVMTPTYSSRNKTQRYRYYVCCSAQKRGWGTCPSKAIPAAEIEQFVLGRIREIDTNSNLLQDALGRDQDATAASALLGAEEVSQGPALQPPSLGE